MFPSGWGWAPYVLATTGVGSHGFSWWTLLTVALASSCPLLLAALGGLFSERSGVVNIGLEGMMLMGAFAAGWVGFALPDLGAASPWLGFLLAGVAGAMLASIHVLLCVVWRTDQIISGVALNLLALQATTFLSLLLFGGKGGTGLLPHTVNKWSIGFLDLSPFFLVCVVVLLATWWLVFRTPFGLRLRGCGEYPAAIASAGISVIRIQTTAVILSGALAGWGGAILVNEAGNFGKNMTAGRGYIALAALIFGGWKPLPAALACLLFGLAYALNFQLQTIPSIRIPSEWINMLPYVLTILALCGLVGRSRPPASLGQTHTVH